MCFEFSLPLSLSASTNYTHTFFLYLSLSISLYSFLRIVHSSFFVHFFLDVLDFLSVMLIWSRYSSEMRHNGWPNGRTNSGVSSSEIELKKSEFKRSNFKRFIFLQYCRGVSQRFGCLFVFWYKYFLQFHQTHFMHVACFFIPELGIGSEFILISFDLLIYEMLVSIKCHFISQ